MTKSSKVKSEFDRAILARQAGDLALARIILNDLLPKIAGHGEKIIAVIHGELGFIHGELGEVKQAEEHYRQATLLAPKAEIASLGLFHSLAGQGRWEDALSEALRHVKIADSPGYRELLSIGFQDDLSPTLRALAEDIRCVLAQYQAL